VRRALLIVALLGCGGERAPAALEQPVVVRTAVWKAGELPGSPPGDGPGPAVTATIAASGIAFAGQSGKAVSGRASRDAVAVAVRFPGAGTGYWVQPLGLADPSNGNELTFDMVLDLSEQAPTGNTSLRFAAIDGQGNAGPQRDLSLCVAGAIPDNLNACDPKIAPPAAVISLGWDGPADLDLQVVTPDGRQVDARHPSTAPKQAPEEAGVLDLDAQAGCAARGPRRENLIWQRPPAPGTYLLYANLFDACGTGASHFALTVHTPESTGEKTSRLVERQRHAGVLLGAQANGGAGPGLYLGAINL
jgi:hypothetical protein